MYNAYMIRNDGKEIPVKVHPYGNPKDVEETLYASQWLYRNTKHEDVKRTVLMLLRAFAYEELGVTEGVLDELKEWIKTFKYVVLTEEFLDEIPELDDIPLEHLDELNTLVCHELNQEFLRARLGGYVNSSASSKEMVFRISSIGFDWFNIIYMFVHDHKRDIETVTIAKDEESTGYENYFYKHKGNVFNQMPVNEFLELSGNPVVENINLRTRAGRMTSGASMFESFGNDALSNIDIIVKNVHEYEIAQEQFVRGD